MKENKGRSDKWQMVSKVVINFRKLKKFTFQNKRNLETIENFPKHFQIMEIFLKFFNYRKFLKYPKKILN